MSKVNSSQNQPFNISDKPGSGQLDAGGSRLRDNLLTKDNLRLSNLEENVQINAVGTEAEQKFRAEKSLEAKVLSRRLLDENFNFNAEDIKAYKAAYGNK